MKEFLKKILPIHGAILLRNIYFKFQDLRNSKRSAREVFTDIYLKQRWGAGGHDRFCSGPGSRADSVIRPYIDLIINHLGAGQNKIVVDLGCGDFYVGRYLLPYCSKYVGVDVVADVVDRNKLSCDRANAEFLCLDIIADSLPDGDICLIRQVLQHLSNEEIMIILQKLKKYPVIFITEHYPHHNKQIIPNKNIIHGEKIRAFLNSGVYLEEPPFNVDPSRIKIVLEVPGTLVAEGCDEGVIRTYKLD